MKFYSKIFIALPAISIASFMYSTNAQAQSVDKNEGQVTKEDSTKLKKEDDVIVNAYVSKNSNYSNKMPLAFIENPQTVSSIDKTVMQNQLLFTVDQALRNIPGIVELWPSTGRSGDGGSYYSLRGFATNNSLRNGLVGAVSGLMDAANVERVEVLKGPSATLYGSVLSGYGGAINRITKQAFDSTAGNVSFNVGSFNTYRGTVDYNTPLTRDKKLLFRVNAAFTSANDFQKAGQGRNFTFAPTLTYNINKRLSLTTEWELFSNHNVMPQLFFIYATPTVLGFDNIKNSGIEYKNSYHGKGLYNTGRTNNVFAKLNYKISDNITSTSNFSNSNSFSNGHGPYFYLYPTSVLTNNASATGNSVVQADQSTLKSNKQYTEFQQNFNGTWESGIFKNRALLGFDFLHIRDRQYFYYTEFGAQPLSGGDYSSFNATSLEALYNTQSAAGTLGNYPSFSRLNTLSSYASDVLTIAKNFNVMAAIRYDKYAYKGGLIGSATAPKYNQSTWSPKFGLVYEIIPSVFSIYANYQNSFQNLGYYINTTAGGINLAKPEQANQIEGGLKATLLKGKITTSLSYYNIGVKNTLRPTGAYYGYTAVQNQEGQQTSKGVEFEINAYLVRGFSFIGGFAYNDSKYTEASSDVIGRRPVTSGSPYTGNFNVNYQFLDGQLKGLGFGVGGNYASENKLQNSVSMGVFKAPAYFIMNANAFYDMRKFRFNLKADNFTSQRYWTGWTSTYAHALINIAAGVTYKF